MSVPLLIFLGTLAAIVIWAGCTTLASKRHVDARIKREKALQERIDRHEFRIKAKSEGLREEVEKLEPVTPEQGRAKNLLAEVLEAEALSRRGSSAVLFAPNDLVWANIIRGVNELDELARRSMVFTTIGDSLGKAGGVLRAYEELSEKLSREQFSLALALKASDEPESRPPMKPSQKRERSKPAT